jgi:hypothetical protein
MYFSKLDGKNYRTLISFQQILSFSRIYLFQSKTGPVVIYVDVKKNNNKTHIGKKQQKPKQVEKTLLRRLTSDVNKKFFAVNFQLEH